MSRHRLYLHHLYLPLTQARRIAALACLPNLTSLYLDPDLGCEALHALASLSGLRDLRLLGNHHLNSHSSHSLQSLVGLSQLTSLGVKWNAGRCAGFLIPTLSSFLPLWCGAVPAAGQRS